MANGDGQPNGTGSHESLASAVRARRLRRLDRPLSLADCPGLPAIVSLINSKAHSTDDDSAFTEDETKKKIVVESRSSGELETMLELQEPRRATSLADFLLRRKQTRGPPPTPVAVAAACNVIENPMHATRFIDSPIADNPLTG